MTANGNCHPDVRYIALGNGAISNSSCDDNVHFRQLKTTDKRPASTVAVQPIIMLSLRVMGVAMAMVVIMHSGVQDSRPMVVVMTVMMMMMMMMAMHLAVMLLQTILSLIAR